MSLHPVGAPVVQGVDLQIHRLQAAEGPLDLGEVLVRSHRLILAEPVGTDIGAHDVDPVHGLLDLQGLRVASEVERGI